MQQHPPKSPVAPMADCVSLVPSEPVPSEPLPSEPLPSERRPPQQPASKVCADCMRGGCDFHGSYGGARVSPATKPVAKLVFECAGCGDMSRGGCKVFGSCGGMPNASPPSSPSPPPSPPSSPPSSPSSSVWCSDSDTEEHKALFQEVLEELLVTNPSEEVLEERERLYDEAHSHYCEDCCSWRCYARYEAQGLLCPDAERRFYEESLPFRALFQEVLEQLQSTDQTVMS